MEREILFMAPHFTHNIWGGTRLKSEYGFDIEGDDIGECWGISAHENGESRVADGEFAGMKLSELWRSKGELFGNGEDNSPFPLLIKIIDAKDDLSIQVHPDDAYAAVYENGSLGKNECWYVLSADPGASLIVGHNAGSRAELERMIDEKRFAELIHEIPIKKGDFIEISAGTVHAIKGGVMVLETQQSSDITYRLYDYDRLMNGKPRELHLSKCKDVISVPSPDTDKLHFSENRELDLISGFDDKKLISNKYFEVYSLMINGSYDENDPDKYRLMTVVEGEGSVNGRPVKKGSFFIIPCGISSLKIEGKMNIIWSRAC